MVVYLCGAAYHPAEKEGSECCGLYRFFGYLACLEGQPYHLEKYYRYDSINIHAVDILAHLVVKQGLNEIVIEIKEYIVYALFLKQAVNKPLSWVVVDLFTFEYRMVNTGHLHIVNIARRLLLCLILAVPFGIFICNSLEVKAMVLISRVLQILIFEAVYQECNGLIAITAVGKACMR